MEITDNNKLIAEFMGWKKGSDYSEKFPFYIPIDGNDTDQTIPLDMKYHSSWDWLMPVVEKIESLKAVTIISQKYCRIAIENNPDNIIRFESRISTINAVYDACIAFIEIYNHQKI